MPRPVDVSQLTIDQVREGALAALSQPGMVFHTTQIAHFSSGGKEYDYKVEVWLDLDRKLARREEYVNGEIRSDDGGLQIYHGDRVAAVYSGRFSDAIFAPAPPPPPPTSTLALDYMRTLFARDTKSVKLSDGTANGQPATVVDIVVPSGESGEETSEQRMFLDEHFLPIRIDRPDQTGALEFRNEFLARDSLPADLFSVDAVRALVKTGAGRMQQAVTAGFHPYWLGEPYYGLPVYDTQIVDGPGPARILSLTYQNDLVANPAAPPYGLHMMEFSPGDFAAWLGATDRKSWWQDPGVQQMAVDVAGGRATIYSAPGRRLEPPSAVGQPTPTPNETPGPNLELVVEYPDAVVLVDANIGPANPYATVEALTKVAQDLRPFEQTE